MSLEKQEFGAHRPVRFPPDALDGALVSFEASSQPFVPELMALIYDESPVNGCALVVRDDQRFQVDALCVVKVGRMDPVRARVAWRREIEPRLTHVGLAYLD